MFRVRILILLLGLSLSGSAYAQINNGYTATLTGTVTAPLNVGAPSIVDTGVLFQGTGSSNSYQQLLIQNTNAGTAASTDIVVNNNLGTATTFYGNFGMNSSGFTGSGSLQLASAVYLFSESGDLVLGTNTSNALHFVINNGATDAMTLTTASTLGIGTSSPAANTLVDMRGVLAVNAVLSNGATFTIASGCGSPGALTGGAVTGSFTAGQASCIPIINLPTASHGWVCSAQDITHTADLFVQTAVAAATCTISSTVTSGDTIVFHAEGY